MRSATDPAARRLLVRVLLESGRRAIEVLALEEQIDLAHRIIYRYPRVFAFADSADDAFLEREGLTKGSMRLIDASEAERLYAHMGPAKEISGGSAGNTAAGIAALGGIAALFVRGDNPDYQTLHLDLDRHPLHIEGVAVGVIRNLNVRP
mgnify:CR=1 FL=1